MNDAKTFKTFLTDVNAAVSAKLGLGINDLPDFAFCDYWDADIADHPADYQNMVESCVEDILYDNSMGQLVNHGEQSYLDGDENYGATYEQTCGH